MTPASRLKGHARLSAAFEGATEKSGKANGAGIKKSGTKAVARAARATQHQGKYKCIICKKGFSRRSTVFDPHFTACVRKNGNPNHLAWDEDPSCWKKGDGPSGVIAPGLNEFNLPVNHDEKNMKEDNVAMTNYYIDRKELIDSPMDAGFAFAENEDGNDADTEMDLDSEPSSASTVVPDTAFFVKGNPALMAETATRMPEMPQTAFHVPQTAFKVVRTEVEVPTAGTAQWVPDYRNMLPPAKPVAKDVDARGLVTYEASLNHNENIDPRLLASRKYPNISSASGLAYDSFRYMIGNPSRFVHHDLHGKKPVTGFSGEISHKTMLQVTNIVIDACRARAAISHDDAVKIFNFFKDTVSADFDRVRYKSHPFKPPIDIKTLESFKALRLSPALGTPRRAQATTYMVLDVYGLMLQHSETLMHQMQIVCLWRDVLSSLGNASGVQELHIVLARELGEAVPMLFEAVEKFSNVV